MKKVFIFGATVYLDTNQGNYTEEDGSFEIMDVIPGSYNLTASFVGYEAQTKFNIIVKSKGNPSFNFILTASSEELDEVVISNQNTISRPKETLLSNTVAFVCRSTTCPGGNNDVVQVAQTLPGVSPSVGGFRNDLIIRGGAPNETVYYLDGMEVPNINHTTQEVLVGILDCLMSLLSMSHYPPQLLAHNMTIRFQVSYSLNSEMAINHN